ncbi:hypothetical protein EON63_25255 [archaeon]|nr:MAG: hypothetical protein EON63_25255 [archaeon]
MLGKLIISRCIDIVSFTTPRDTIHHTPYTIYHTSYTIHHIPYTIQLRAINMNPNDPHIWNSLGVLYYAFGQCRESLGMLSRAVYLDPMLPEAWYNVS